ncbi:caspase family protein [Asanoa siamensis]|uniref:WD40 repeat protein n=1 Tax=Asanoa siamensis TaxID=926357 RepID=A0ABQ4CXR8_9ACTN|nr:caspase family protein [Asanoa siamensis]GIF76064.1 hypothetical protein Asi02nite_55820 [Asanoa siamensis]
MPDGDGHRRFLVSVGVTTGLSASRAALAGSVESMAALFTEQFGYARVPSFGLDPSAQRFRTELRRFCREREPDDVVVVYHTGHADLVGERHRLWMGGTEDPYSDTVSTSELAELMLAETPLRHALLILDSCFAGHGGAEALLTGMRSVARAEGKTLVVLTASHPLEQVRAGDFARLFGEAVRHKATAGHEPRYLSLSAVAAHIMANPGRPGWQTVSVSELFRSTAQLPFLPNQRYDTRLHGLDLFTQLRMAQGAAREEEIAQHFLPRARGVDLPTETGWWFEGRHLALRELVGWLASDEDRRSRVVTGDPGSGKSAVVSRLAVLSDPALRAAVPRGAGLPADTVPPVGAVDLAVHARRKPTQEVMDALCGAFDAPVNNLEGLLSAVRNRPLVVAVDALDEALDPVELVDGLLRPLLDWGPEVGLRLVLGTRRHLLPRLGPNVVRIDLDDDTHADPDAMLGYVRRLLLDGPGYRDVAPEVVSGVATAVTAAAGNSFLVARITARTLAARPPADEADPAWRAALPRTAAEAMRQDLDVRLGDAAGRARDLLTPVAYAQGGGLPWEDVWAPLASALSGRHYSDDDVLWLHRNAGAYLVESGDHDRSVYRLYHEALAEYLRADGDPARSHGVIADVLLDRVPIGPGGRRDWSRAQPYPVAHLATHAARSGRLDTLLAEAGFLVAARSAELLTALGAAEDERGRAATRVYQRAVHLVTASSGFGEAAAHLDFVARRSGADFLVEDVARQPVPRPWAVSWVRWAPEQLRLAVPSPESIEAIDCAVLGDGRGVAVTGSFDGVVRIWDLATGDQLAALPGHVGPINVLRCGTLADGRPVAVSAGFDRTVRSWDLESGRPLATILGPVERDARTFAQVSDQSGASFSARGGPITHLAVVSRPGRPPLAVTGSFDGTVRTWDVSAGRYRGVLVDRSRLVTGYSVRQTRTGGRSEFYGESQAPPIEAMDCAVLADGTAVAVLEAVDSSGGHTERLEVWDIDAHRLVRTIVIPVVDETWRRTSAIGRIICVSGLALIDSTFTTSPTVYDLGTGGPAGHLSLGGHGALAVADLPGTGWTAVSPGWGTLEVQPLPAGEKWSVPIGGPHVSAIAAGPATDAVPLAVTAGHDGLLRLWDLRPPQDAAAHPAIDLVAACTLPDGVGVVAGASRGTLTVWAAATGETVARHPLPGTAPQALRTLVLPDGTAIAAVVDDEQMCRVLSLADGGLLAEIDLLPPTDRAHRSWVFDRRRPGLVLRGDPGGAAMLVLDGKSHPGVYGLPAGEPVEWEVRSTDPTPAIVAESTGRARGWLGRLLGRRDGAVATAARATVVAAAALPSPDHDSLVVVDDRGTVHVVDARSGATRLRFQGFEPGAAVQQWSFTSEAYTVSAVGCGHDSTGRPIMVVAGRDGKPAGETTDDDFGDDGRARQVVRVFDLTDGTLLREHGAPDLPSAIVPMTLADGRTLICTRIGGSELLFSDLDALATPPSVYPYIDATTAFDADAPIRDVAFCEPDTVMVATSNGIVAIRLDPDALPKLIHAGG